MKNFIRTCIERLRRFIRGKRDTAEQAPEYAAGPIRGEVDLDADRGRFNTAVLTRSGIRFKGMQYHQQSVTEMLLDDISRFDSKSGARAKVTINWDPSDASRISVWNRAARPGPHWVTLPIGGDVTGERLSFADHVAIREFAKKHDLVFNTDEERSEARELLRQHWQEFAARPAVRENRQSPRHARRLPTRKGK